MGEKKPGKNNTDKTSGITSRRTIVGSGRSQIKSQRTTCKLPPTLLGGYPDRVVAEETLNTKDTTISTNASIEEPIALGF